MMRRLTMQCVVVVECLWVCVCDDSVSINSTREGADGTFMHIHHILYGVPARLHRLYIVRCAQKESALLNKGRDYVQQLFCLLVHRLEYVDCAVVTLTMDYAVRMLLTYRTDFFLYLICCKNIFCCYYFI